MKRLSLLFAFSILLACTAPMEIMDKEAPSEEPPEVTQQQRTEEIEQTEQERPEEKETHPAVADWLLRRQGLCHQHRDAIDAQLERHRSAFIATSAKDQGVLLHSQLQALMLASCDPERTPGLFREFLQHMGRSTTMPLDYHALFELMSSQLNAYSALEQRYRELEARHQKTIEGIGNIERFLEPEAEPDQ